MFDIDHDVVNRLAKARVLIVEDQPLNILLLQNLLSEHYQVSAVTSGLKALEVCTTFNPDLILLDIQMDGLDGIETCNRLKKLPETKDTPVIFITSYHEHEEFCWQAGGVDFIAKPIVGSTVLHRVKAHLTIKFQRDKLLELVFIDSLTGVYNRRYFDSHFEKIVRQAKRTKENYAVILLDIDFFKQYNDIYGHLEGDKVLNRVAKTISHTLKRPTDFVARYGGEEFIVVLPSTNLDGAILIAENIIKSIYKLGIAHEYSPSKYLTASAGIATQHNATAQTDILLLADNNLYTAKSSGRNKVIF
jgi:diguanylate cyclase (GGDEF)-like protein